MSGPRQGELFGGDWALRWNGGRSVWQHRHQRDLFTPDHHEAVLLPDDGPARTFLEAHHYLAGWPAAVHRIGLIDHRHPGTDGLPGRLVGVMVLSVPTNVRVLTNPFPHLVPYTETLEVSRLCLKDEVGFNGESWFCAAAFRLVAERGVRGVVSFSDPAPYRRRTVYGTEVVTKGHIGTTYQALNFQYLGRTARRTEIVLPDGSVLHDRCVTKVRRGERGAAAVERRLVALGARPRIRGQTGTAWLDQVLNEIGATRRPSSRKHRYALAIGRPRTVIGMTALPYPKSDAWRAAHPA